MPITPSKQKVEAEAEAGGSLSSRAAWSTERGPDNQGYTERPCLDKQNRKQKPNKQKYK